MQKHARSTTQTKEQPVLSTAPFSSGSGYWLYRGDSLDLLSQFAPRSFDLVFADPPYFLSNGGFTCKAGRRAPVRKGRWDQSRGLEEDYAFTVAWLKACQRVLKPEGSLWVSGTHHVIFSVGFALQKLGFKLLNMVTWYKPNASPNLSCRYFTHSTELLLWAAPEPAGKLLHTFNYQQMKFQNGGKQMRDVWALPRAGEEELAPDARGRVWSMLSPRKGEKALGSHPTQKPLALLQRIVESSSKEGDWVLDPFNGSGTTGLAALRLGRKYVGIDINSEYLSLTSRRFEAEQKLRRSA